MREEKRVNVGTSTALGLAFICSSLSSALGENVHDDVPRILYRFSASWWFFFFSSLTSYYSILFIKHMMAFETRLLDSLNHLLHKHAFSIQSRSFIFDENELNYLAARDLSVHVRWRCTFDQPVDNLRMIFFPINSTVGLRQIFFNSWKLKRWLKFNFSSICDSQRQFIQFSFIKLLFECIWAYQTNPSD